MQKHKEQIKEFLVITVLNMVKKDKNGLGISGAGSDAEL